MSSVPSVSFSLISKIASQSQVELDDSHASTVILGFMDGLQKQGGLSVPESLGVVRYFAEMGGMPKTALAGGVSHGATIDNIYNKVTAPIKAGLQSVGSHVQAGMAPGQTKVIDDGIAKGRDMLTGVGKDFSRDFIPNAVGGAWNKAKEYLGNSDNLKAMAPYAIGGLGTFLGSKLLGAGTGTSLLAGAAGAAAAGYGYKHMDQIKKHLAPAQATPAAPAAPAAAPAQTPQPLAFKPVAEANSSNADAISQRALGGTDHPAVTPDSAVLHGIPFSPARGYLPPAPLGEKVN